MALNYKDSFTPQDEMQNFNTLKAAINGATGDIGDLTETVGGLSTTVEGLSTTVGGLTAQVTEKAIIITSSTESSTKKFSITVDDEGELTATEVTEEA